MAWIHDGIGQGKQADALWVDMHAEARLGRVDVAKCARVAAGLNNWNRGARGRSIPSVSASCADDDGTTETRESIIESIVEEVYALEIASKARRRPRAAAGDRVELHRVPGGIVAVHYVPAVAHACDSEGLIRVRKGLRPRSLHAGQRRSGFAL